MNANRQEIRFLSCLICSASCSGVHPLSPFVGREIGYGPGAADGRGWCDGDDEGDEDEAEW